MAALTLTLPDDKHRRLRALAQRRGTAANGLLVEMVTLLLTESGAETRCRLRQASGAGRVAQGLAVLDDAAPGGAPQAQ